MPTAALIPIRSYKRGKERLGSVLTEAQRKELGEAMAERTVVAVEEAGMLPAVISVDPGVTQWAATRGLQVIPESGPGLDNAAISGVRWAEELGLSWVVLHSDLPLVQPQDLSIVAESVLSGRGVIAPSADGGTTALSAPGFTRFAYGPGSFHRHLAAAGDVTVVAATGLLHDLDSPADLRSASTHPSGVWLKTYLTLPE